MVGSATQRLRQIGVSDGIASPPVGRGVVGHSLMTLAQSPVPVLEFADLTLGYDRHPAVHHLNACIEEGSLTAVVGPNGAGKTTLLRGISGSLPPLGGRIEWPGAEAAQLAYLPQHHDVDRSFPMPVFDLVSMGMWRQVGAFGGLFGTTRSKVLEALAAVGLTGFERRPIASLSGGQFQRALFARLLLQDAPVILLDEPFTAVDSKTARDLLAVVQRWHGERRTVLAVLHDLDVVREYFPSTLLLSRQMIAMGPTESVLTSENLLRARALNEAFDERATACGGAVDSTVHRNPARGQRDAA